MVPGGGGGGVVDGWLASKQAFYCRVWWCVCAGLEGGGRGVGEGGQAGKQAVGCSVRRWREEADQHCEAPEAS